MTRRTPAGRPGGAATARPSSVAIAAALALIAWPTAARADMGVPVVAGISGAAVALLAVVVLLEGGILQHDLRIPLGRALWASLAANLGTCAIGVVLGMLSAILLGTGADLLLLPTMLVGTVLVEWRILRRMLQLTGRRALGLSLKVNAASYAVVILVAIELLANRAHGPRSRPPAVAPSPSAAGPE